MSDLDPAPRSTLGRVAKRKSAPNETPDSLQDLLHALQAMRSGDFSVRMTGDHLGVEGKIADTFNEIVAPIREWRSSWSMSVKSSAEKEKPGNASSSTLPADHGRTWRARSTR
jgi:hypothetical protein